MNITSAEILEFDELKRLLGRFISSPLGAGELERAIPICDRAALEETLADVSETIEHERALAQPQPAARKSAVRIRFNEVPDCREATAKVRIEGAVLDSGEVLALISLLELAAEIRSALNDSSQNFPRLAGFAERIGEFRSLLRDLSGKILPGGAVADDASVALKRLRREIEQQQRRIQQSLERFLSQHSDEGLLQEDFVTIRNDRFVVPIIAGQHRRVDGVVHGSSGTGHTLFVEPLETIELNNELVHLVEEEAREVHRILREMTQRLRDAADEIASTTKVMGELEFLFAKARFALKFDCKIPRFSPDGSRRLMLRDARHPLLEDVLQTLQRRIVPVSLTLSDAERTLLISGPNTGGKTVTLKTVGLLVLMAQTGLPVPCAEAEFPLFSEVLADIGDNQSIQESLSTFSAHITRIREMVDGATSGSLVLLDELGRATDPEEGGALGIAILENFHGQGAFTLSSTHLLALKIYGANTAGVINGSMGFDDKTLEPTYLLRTGAPGKSAGLDVARRLGLPLDLIQRAHQAMSTSERDIALFLNQLHQRLERISQLEESLQQDKASLVEKEKTLTEGWKKKETAKLAEIERRGDLAIRQFEERADAAIEDIRRLSSQKKTESQARRKVARAKRKFQEELGGTISSQSESAARTSKIAEGATVRLRGVQKPARVVRILKNDLIEVAAGYLKLQISIDDVIEVLPESEPAPYLPENVAVETGPRWDITSQEINVIGRRAEEAYEEVDKFLDTAVLASVDRVRIVHGHGMGVLRKVVTELLASNPNVEKFYPATQNEGGTGATIAELKA